MSLLEIPKLPQINFGTAEVDTDFVRRKVGYSKKATHFTKLGCPSELLHSVILMRN